RPKVYPNITYQDAQAFKQRYDFQAVVSVGVSVSRGATVQYQSEKTNPNVVVQGSDENYLITGGDKLALGRNFSDREVELGGNVALIGADIRQKLFKQNENPIDRIITLGGARFTVIGVLESKGSSAGFGGDNMVII